MARRGRPLSSTGRPSSAKSEANPTPQEGPGHCPGAFFALSLTFPPDRPPEKERIPRIQATYLDASYQELARFEMSDSEALDWMEGVAGDMADLLNDAR